MEKQKKVEKLSKMPVVNAHAAGIDVGSKFHFVAIGQEKDEVKQFGCYTEDLHSLCQWLRDNEIQTVALESTGSYFRPLFILLQDYGLNPILVNGKYTKNVSGKKTDVLDCQWIQKMHSLGLLEPSFIPDLFTEKLRQYCRHRQSLIDECAKYKNKMQKALRLMNIRLDAVITEITGVSGTAIVQAILDGERDPKVLASLTDYRIKKSKQEIELALRGDWRYEYVFELRHCYSLYCFCQERVKECDLEIQSAMEKQIEETKTDSAPEYLGTGKRLRRNDPNIGMQKMSFHLTGGIDLSNIEGVGTGTIMTLISEVGLDLSSFRTARHFASWLGLSPNKKVSGGKIISSRVRKGKNRLSEALRYAANGVGNTRKGGMLHQFFKRIEYRKGRVSAIIATARKIAVIIWTMLTKKLNYKPVPLDEYTSQMRQTQLRSIKRKIRQLNVKPEEIDFAIGM